MISMALGIPCVPPVGTPKLKLEVDGMFGEGEVISSDR